MSDVIKHFDQNTKGRDMFTTDLHGHYDLLHEQLSLHAFDSTVDRLFVGGDMCDRHPDSTYILDYIYEPWLHCVQGNHEAMVIDYWEAFVECGKKDHPSLRQPFQMLYCNGGEWFFDCSLQKQEAIYEAFKSLPLAIEIETANGLVGIVHSQAPYNNWNEFKKMLPVELDFNAKATLQWARTNYDKRYSEDIKGLHKLYTGHTPTDSGEVETYGNTVYADLGSFFRNKVSFIQIN